MKKIKDTMKAKVEGLALSNNNRTVIPGRLIEAIHIETSKVDNQLVKLNNASSDEYTTPQLLIMALKHRFKHLDTILIQIIMLLGNQIKIKHLAADYNQQQYNQLLDALQKHRQAVSSAMTELLKTSVERQYALNNFLYNRVLMLSREITPLLELLESNQVFIEFLPDIQRETASLHDVVIRYLKQMEYLPYLSYMRLLRMELAEQQVRG